MSVQRLLSSDGALFALLIPLTLFFASMLFLFRREQPSSSSSSWAELWDLLNPFSLTQRRRRLPPLSLQRAIHAYASYTRLAEAEVDRMKRSYASRLGRGQKKVGYEIGYPAKLDRLGEIARVNGRVAEGIARLARGREKEGEEEGVYVDGVDLGKMREAMKHFVRDWSAEGKDERRKMFEPVLDVFREDSNGKKVLLPGAGLGRLAWEISQLGFDTTANEISPFMTLPFKFLLDPNALTTADEHTIHPFAHWLSHSRSTDVTFRPISFPDVLPRLSSTFHLSEDDFFLLRASEEYDYVVTLFFIDTSLNLIRTLEHIHALLRPGGTWINLGPLLWTGGAQAGLELSLEEVLDVARRVGFVFEEDGVRRARSIDCEYTADKHAMMSWIYHAEFWVARKRGETLN